MSTQNCHLSDHEMLLAADGELSPRCAARVRNHLSACWGCRGRMAEIEETITAFARVHRQNLDHQLPSISGPRALLRARLAEAASNRRTDWWERLLNLTPMTYGVATIIAATLIAMAGSSLVHRSASHRGTGSAVAAYERDVLPDRMLTPGVTRKVSAVNEVCSMAHEEVVAEVSIPLRQEVFQRYGISNAHANDYEIDYLIAPGLGGAEAVGNLWPEPYMSRTWNAHVKDDLEERLHDMVCDREVDLAQAQRDIATNWIAAYKKYFHTDRPLSEHADIEEEILKLNSLRRIEYFYDIHNPYTARIVDLAIIL